MAQPRTLQHLALSGSLLCAAPALGQGVFSVDFQGPPKGSADACTGAVRITEADLLRTFTGAPAPGPGPGPCIYLSGGLLGLPLYAAGVGTPAGTPGRIELDAVSFGRDFRPLAAGQQYRWVFSVDEWARGAPAAAPSVFSEGRLGNAEASADLWVDTLFSPGPVCPGPFVPNTGVVDGNGVAPWGGLGLGLVEPNPAAPGTPDAGSNIDAIDIDTPNLLPPTFPVYFSLDSRIPDPLEGIGNSGSAVANGLGVGGDIFVVRTPGGPIGTWAPAAALGLDFFGIDTDDIDALIIWDNGNGVYDRPFAPFSWRNGNTDFVAFSLRRNSALITNGVPDGLCNTPIEEGDLLVPPFAPGTPPGIWIAAEQLGLSTRRSGTTTRADDLNAADNFCAVPGDVDADGDVDLQDLAIVIGNFGCSAPPACPGDVNFDGVVNLLDLSIVLANFGLSC